MCVAVAVERPALGFELELVEVSGFHVTAERVLGGRLLLGHERVLRPDPATIQKYTFKISVSQVSIQVRATKRELNRRNDQVLSKES